MPVPFRLLPAKTWMIFSAPANTALLDLIDIARLTGHLPENRALIGIQPLTTDWGMHPSEPVQAALEPAVNEAVKIITQWQKINTDQEVSAA